jgi:hypothetical protein
MMGAKPRHTSPSVPRKKTVIAGAFIAHPRQLLESPSRRVLSLAERRVLDRIELEHIAHGGAENGKLPVTYADFERWGVRPDSIAGAVRALEALGLIEITRHGYAGAAEKRAPSLYRLTYLTAWNAGRADGTGTHEYLKIETVKEAEETAKRARKAINPRNSARARRNFATPQSVPISPHKLRCQTQNSRPTNCGVHASPPICGALSISREDTGQSKPLAKRAPQSAVASERLARTSDKFPAEDQPEQRLGAVASKIIDLLPQRPAENNKAEHEHSR